MELLELLRNIELLQGIILLAGLVLVIIEMFNPGFGVPGITGGILLLAGVVMTAKSFTQAMILILILLAILGAALGFVLRSARKGHLKKRIVLSHSERREYGYVATENHDIVPGSAGIAVTVLRPSGAADFNGARMDVVSNGAFISPGSKIRVVRVEGRRIVVADRKSVV